MLASAATPALAQGITVNALTQICGATGPGITVNAAIGNHLIVHNTQTGCSAVSTAPFSTIGNFVATVLGADIVYSTVTTTSGTIVVTFTGGKTLTVIVAGTTPSTLESGVKAQISGQTGATLRFSQSQLRTIANRIQNLHGAFESSKAEDTSATTSNLVAEDPAQPDAFGLMQFATSERRSAGGDTPPLMFESSGLSSFRKALHERGATVWVGGLFDNGNFGDDGLGYDFRSAALTVGLDGRLSKRVMAGVTFGYARDFTDYDDLGSETNSRSFTVSTYGTYKATDTLYVDAVAGYSDVDLDNHRWDSTSSMLLSGNREGRSWFGSLALSNEWRTAKSLISPYVQTSVISSRLDDYSESDMSVVALTYDGMSFTNVAITGGVYASYDLVVGSGILRPFAKADFTHNTNTSTDQGLYYSALGTSDRTFFDIDMISQSVATGDLGLSYIDADGNQASVWGRASAGSNDFSAQSLGVSLKTRF